MENMEKEPDELSHLPDALNLALEREKLAYEFYLKAANKVEDAGVKTLFTQLAKEEKGHIARIQAVIDREIMRDM